MQGQSDRSFLINCKRAVSKGSSEELIIQDSRIFPSPFHSTAEILVSQYIMSLHEDAVNSLVLKKSYQYSIPIIYAAYEKLIRKKDYDDAILLLENLRSSTDQSKHLVIYNMAKIHALKDNHLKATFFYQNILKESVTNIQFAFYDYCISLIKLGRVKEAELVSRKRIQRGNCKTALIKSLYIKLLAKKQKEQIIHELQLLFHNQQIDFITCFNLALLLKKVKVEKALELFQKLNECVEDLRILVKIKLNIIEIKEKQIKEKKSCSELHYCFEGKKLLEEIERYYEQIKSLFQQCMSSQERSIYDDRRLNIINRKKQFDKILKQKQNLTLNQQNPKQELKNTLKSKRQCRKLNHSFIFRMLHEADWKQHENGEEKKKSKFIKSLRQKRSSFPKKDKDKKNEEKLKFLLSKQKELNNFFNRIRIYKNKDQYDIKLLSHAVIGSRNEKSSLKCKPAYSEEFQVQFEKKVKKYNLLNEKEDPTNLLKLFFHLQLNNNNPQEKSKLCFKKKKDISFHQTQRKIDFKQTNKSLLSSKKTEKKSEQKISREEKNQRVRLKTRDLVKKTTISSKKIIEKQINQRSKTQKQQTKILLDNNEKTQRISIEKNNISNKSISSQHMDTDYEKKTFENEIQFGDKLEMKGKLQEAYDHFLSLYKKYKQDEEKQRILLKIGNNFELRQMDDEAEKTYLKCAKYKTAEVFYRLGNLQIRNGKVSTGVENLEKANCIDKQNLEIETKLVYGYSLLDETANRALSLANTILKSNPNSLEALIMTSKVLEKQGKTREALEIALAISKSKNSPTLNHYIGLLYLHESDISQAFNYFQKALKLKPNHIPSLVEIATILSDAKPKDAISILKKVMEIDPTNQLACARLGKIYESSEKSYDKAIQAYQMSNFIEPNYQSFLKIGDCYFYEKCYVEAATNYREALSLKKSSEAYDKLAIAYEKQGHIKKAIDSYVLALEQLAKDNTCFGERKKYLIEMGRLSLLQQEFQNAQAYLLEATEMEDSYQLYKMLGQSYFGKGEYLEALECFRQALSLEKEQNTELLESIASCFDKQEEYLASKDIYEKILISQPKNINCLNNLANIHLIIGNTNEAFYYFQQMLQEAPNNIQKRIRVVDIYATIGDWSKVEEHLQICYRQKESDIRVIERMLNLYKEKRESKQVAKFEKRLNFLRQNKHN